MAKVGCDFKLPNVLKRAASPMQVFVETHFYDGGFKSYLVPGYSRPDILPPVESVGLRSTEAELAEGDYALEYAKFQNGACDISWIGCYTRALDTMHGDRGAYCGIGIWLVDAILIHSLHLVGFLRQAATTLAKVGAHNAGIPRKLQRFAEEFDDLGWCTGVARKGLSIPMQAFASGDEFSSYVVLPNRDKENFDLAGIDILDQSRTRVSPGTCKRRIYFLAPKSRIFVSETRQVTYKSALTYAEHIIHSIDSRPHDTVDGRLRSDRPVAAL